MSWTRYLKHDYFTAQELDAIDGRLARTRRRNRQTSRRTAQLTEEVARLEDDVERLSLLVCTLLNLGLEKQAFTPLDFQRKLEQLDAVDGAIDGKLGTQWMRNDESDDSPREGGGGSERKSP